MCFGQVPDVVNESTSRMLDFVVFAQMSMIYSEQSVST
jgi:hypothetical protein